MSNQDKIPKFTVIIPVKDRAEYLQHSLRTCSLQDYENLEIIVSDDGSTDHTRDVVEEAARKDSRISYVSPGSSGVGMLQNFEFALNQVKPGYVIALGGDDGLLPYGIRGMLDELQDSGKEMLAWPAPVFFYAKTRMETSQLILHAKKGRLQSGSRIIQSLDFLERQANKLGYVSDIESPMFYVKGVTSTRLVEKVRSRSTNGQFYACATPDGYSGIVLAGEVHSYAFSGKPFSIHGVSPTSAGVGYLSNNDQAKKQSAAFFRNVSHKPMHSELGAQPYSPLISLMTADFLLTARDLPGWPGSFSPIDYRHLLVNSLAELVDGLFAEDRVARELSILYRIADYHGLGEFFRKKVKDIRKNLRKPLEGNAISSNRIYIDGSRFGIHNVFDAAYVAHYMHQIAQKVSVSAIWNMVTNSLEYGFRSLRIGSRFPSESEWIKEEKVHSQSGEV
jgi:glycosyltransferase involved in cell wall biosynthesis